MSLTHELAARVRTHIIMDPRITEKRMFGGMGFMLDGNMALGVTGKGELMVRLGKGNDHLAQKFPGTQLVDLAARRQGGFIMVPNEMVENDDHLTDWINLAMSFTASLPPK